ncbi:MAG: DnaD domain protein [Intestinibacillus sp.]
MSLPALLLTGGEFCVLRAEVADRLIKCGDADGALLYLYLVRRGAAFDEKTAMRELGFSRERYDRAAFTLTSLELAANPSAPVPSETPAVPAYRPAELRQARQGDRRFAAVCDTAESVLGRTLTEGQLRTLFMVYDHLGLPADVIIELLAYLKREKGTVRRRDIEQEACLWADMGLFTAQDAATYLSRRDAERPLIAAMLETVGITGREPTANEQRCLSEFIARGFPADAVALAAHRMEQAIGKFSWQYLRKILASWDQKGIHTVAEITALEPEKSRPAAPPASHTPSAKLEAWEQEWLQEVKNRKRQQEE